MRKYGDDYMTNPVTQVKFAVAYVSGKRYGSACAALAFWQRVHWY